MHPINTKRIVIQTKRSSVYVTQNEVQSLMPTRQLKLRRQNTTNPNLDLLGCLSLRLEVIILSTYAPKVASLGQANLSRCISIDYSQDIIVRACMTKVYNFTYITTIDKANKQVTS